MQALHDDSIHDISFDMFGKRIATCSSDHKIRIWKVSENGNWSLCNDIKAHDSSVLRVVWGHPSFGNILASCSLDRSVRIWEGQGSDASVKWCERARLLDSKGSVRDVAFAPHWQGLKLATCSTDGLVRIYEAIDVGNLAYWALMEEFEIFQATKEMEGQCCLSWCQSKHQTPKIIVSCGKENCAKIFSYNEGPKKWTLITTLKGHGDLVQDVAWSPSLGRSYEIVATGCRDSFIRIFKFQDDQVELLAEFDDHKENIWKLQFNITGNLLSSCGDDGTVRLWRCNLENQWACISVISFTNQEINST